MCSKKYTKNTQIKNIEEQQEQHVRVTSTDQTMCVCSFASVFERTSGFLGDGSRRISWFLLFCASRAPSAAATCAVPRHGGGMWRRGRYASHEARCGTVWQSMAWQGDQQQFHLWKTQKTQKLFEQLMKVSLGSQYSWHLFQIIHGSQKLLTRSCLLRQCFKLITTRSELSLNLAEL